jgi:hypothetical protein
LDELESEGARLVAADPDLSTLDRDDYPLPVCAAGIAEWAEQLDHGLGFVLVRGLRVGEYSNELSSAIFFLLGLWLGNPMRQNRAGDVLTHIIATTSKPAYSAPNVLSSRTTSELSFHSDSADVVGLMCLHSAKEGGASVLASGTTVYNEVVRRRPDPGPELTGEHVPVSRVLLRRRCAVHVRRQQDRVHRAGVPRGAAVDQGPGNGAAARR